MEKDTKDTIIELSKEFDEKEGYVTCEISIHKDKINEMRDFITNNPNIELKLGKWVIIECDTCVEYNGEGYLHASIERFPCIERIVESSNYITQI